MSEEETLINSNSFLVMKIIILIIYFFYIQKGKIFEKECNNKISTDATHITNICNSHIVLIGNNMNFA